MSTINSAHFVEALLLVLDETFDRVYGVYLDKGTSFFETLAQISAEEASIPVGGQCATLAAQVKHTAFYLDVIVRSVREPEMDPVNWDEIWQTVGAVSADEWQAIQDELRAAYGHLVELIQATQEWSSARDIAGAMAAALHTAYHLGEVRQALCCLRPGLG